GPMLGNYIMGINPMDIQLVNQRIQEFSYIGMRNGWVDAAFWDIIGKVKKEPLWKVLGGSGGFLYPYLSTGSTHNHDQKIIRDIVHKRKDEGYRGIKLRVKSTDLSPMVEYIKAGRDAAGPDMDIMVDANQGWPVDIVDETPKWDVAFATRFAQAIEPFNVRWLEEPLNRGNFEGLAELCKNTKTPIAGGEMNST
ncbi:MAG: mandelate racemase/muconate lactonizing enzyme family protein, partial [bacterium]|nr:mandelate racemase/muconate lactonizing enzyme family protein [bacterium]